VGGRARHLVDGPDGSVVSPRIGPRRTGGQEIDMYTRDGRGARAKRIANAQGIGDVDPTVSRAVVVKSTTRHTMSTCATSDTPGIKKLPTNHHPIAHTYEPTKRTVGWLLQMPRTILVVFGFAGCDARVIVSAAGLEFAGAAVAVSQRTRAMRGYELVAAQRCRPRAGARSRASAHRIAIQRSRSGTRPSAAPGAVMATATASLVQTPGSIDSGYRDEDPRFISSNLDSAGEVHRRAATALQKIVVQTSRGPVRWRRSPISADPTSVSGGLGSVRQEL